MSDKEIIFTDEEIQNLLAGDAGFKRMLNGMSKGQAAGVKSIITNHKLLNILMKFLPKNYKYQFQQIFDKGLTKPDHAVRFYEEGRFFEAREMLLKYIELFNYTSDTKWGALNKAVDFSTKRARSLCYHLLGEIEWTLGNAENAGYCYGCSLEIAKEINDVDTIAKALLGLGIYNGEKGEYGRAFDYCQTALKTIEGLPEDPWRLRQKTLNAMGVMLSSIGESDGACECALQALEICRETDDRRNLPVCLNNFAIRLVGIEEYETALNVLYEGLDIAEEENNLCMQALILCNLGDVKGMYNGPDADETVMADIELLYERALQLGEETGSKPIQALAMRSIGQLNWRMGDYNAALGYFEDALQICRRIGARADEAGILLDLGMFLRDGFDDIEGACQRLRECIAIIETMRSGLKRETHRITFAHQSIEPYALIVESLVQCGHIEEALTYVERSKSRAMLDLLGTRLQKNMLLKSESPEFVRALTLLKEMDELRMALDSLQHDEEGGDEKRGGHTASDAELSNAMIDELILKEKSFAAAYAAFSAVDPETASLVGVAPVMFDHPADMLDEETILVNLYQTDKALLMFFVAGDANVESFTVPMSGLEAEEIIWNLTLSMQESATYDVRAHAYIREVQRPLTDLYDRLFQPVEKLISRYKRIIIAPHLFWHYLPFHALYDRKGKAFLCDRFEVGICPSASVLKLCIEKNRTGRGSALIMSRDNGDLPYADHEADLLAASFYPECAVFKGQDANWGNLRSRPEGYDIIHLACHGMFDGSQPFLSGIDIPPDADEARRTYLLDLFDMHLNCTQVTLSSCESGMNQFTSADELTGLSRGLFYAGAASVMLSLWKVGDESTCQLMENYYWHFAKNMRTKTRALQLAMQALKSRPEFAHPRFWAPFVIMGDWR